MFQVIFCFLAVASLSEAGECDSGPCLNNGTCVPASVAYSSHGFTCRCTTEYGGHTCDRPLILDSGSYMVLAISPAIVVSLFLGGCCIIGFCVKKHRKRRLAEANCLHRGTSGRPNEQWELQPVAVLHPPPYAEHQPPLSPSLPQTNYGIQFTANSAVQSLPPPYQEETPDRQQTMQELHVSIDQSLTEQERPPPYEVSMSGVPETTVEPGSILQQSDDVIHRNQDEPSNHCTEVQSPQIPIVQSLAIPIRSGTSEESTRNLTELPPPYEEHPTDQVMRMDEVTDETQSNVLEDQRTQPSQTITDSNDTLERSSGDIS